ncbi:MAG: hypothetical protein LAO51_07140 [Acidobacteriia bacterium]|nr:hypothetical protein [Terriglobia bacterium]
MAKILWIAEAAADGSTSEPLLGSTNPAIIRAVLDLMRRMIASGLEDEDDGFPDIPPPDDDGDDPDRMGDPDGHGAPVEEPA